MKALYFFLNEIRVFSKHNWWIYLIYVLMLAIIFETQDDRLLSVILSTSIHFVADIFIMMMLSAYSDREYVRGTYFQIISMFLFLSLKLYTGFIEKSWHYLLADPIYILAAFKNYNIDVKKRHIEIINYRSMLVISVLILCFSTFSMNTLDSGQSIINTFSKFIQTTGILFFAVGLSTTNNEKLRFNISIFALTLMVVGSFWETYDTWIQGKILGLALSYALLPLTVLVFYLKQWKITMKENRS